MTFPKKLISVDVYNAVKKATNGTFIIEFSLSTDRSGGETVSDFIDFVDRVKVVADMLEIDYKQLKIHQDYDSSDHEVVCKYVHFVNFDFREVKKCIYRGKIVNVEMFNDIDEVCSVVDESTGATKLVGYGLISDLMLENFVDWN